MVFNLTLTGNTVYSGGGGALFWVNYGTTAIICQETSTHELALALLNKMQYARADLADHFGSLQACEEWTVGGPASVCLPPSHTAEPPLVLRTSPLPPLNS